DSGTDAIDPQVETVGRVGHALAFEHVEIVVDQQEVGGGDLLEAQSEAHHVVAAGPRPARGELAGQRRIVALHGEDAAGERQFLPRRPGGRVEVAVEPFVGLPVIGRLVAGDDAHSIPPRIRGYSAAIALCTNIFLSKSSATLPSLASCSATSMLA